MANEPSRIPQAWATANTTTNSIPNTTTESGKASWEQGFPLETSLALSAGGVPPKYGDFNGVLQVLSQFAIFQQDGGQFAYDNATDYTAGCLVTGSDGALYECLVANGPGSTVTNPVGDTSGTWGKIATSDELSLYALDANVVKLAGAQTISGSKTFSSTIILAQSEALKRNVDTGYTRMEGATSTSDGAYLDLFGQNHTSYPGYFRLSAMGKHLWGYPDGTLTWNAKGFVYDSGDQTISGNKTIVNSLKFDKTATINGVSTNHSATLAMNGTSLNVGFYDVSSSGWVIAGSPGGTTFTDNAFLAQSGATIKNGAPISGGLTVTGGATISGGITVSGGVTIPITSAVPTYNSGFADYSSTTKVAIIKKGAVCQIHGAVKPTEETASGSFTVCTIPQGYRPVAGITVVQQGSGMNRFLLSVTSNGNVNVERYGTTSSATSVSSGTWLNMACTYICE